ncbi:MAG: cytochrome C [Pelodictyon luteolum]|uniref:Cytochrome C n=1 Tax=Pelodictyon luteolum TaxID=1100 RepID=A0A165M1S5_PELLU|nr:cytochrome c [Pelodictyon luteolum]KZK74710.1 MAG: cytochrome C [Pelodictyon luteolum]
MKQAILPLAAGLIFSAAAVDCFAAVPDGKAVFERNCSVCHSVAPPPKSAPPIIPIAARYRAEFATKAAGVKAMTAFMQSPSKAASVIEVQAIERFGLMPSMSALSEADLRAVAGWVWDQGGAGMGPGRGAGQPKGTCR